MEKWSGGMLEYWSAEATEAVKMPSKHRGPIARVLLGVLAALALCSCATQHQSPAGDSRRFDFQKDTFSYPNELTWEYRYDPNGKWTTRWREPRPAYSQHCFVVARSARQFFLNARFAAERPVADKATYRRLIRRVVGCSPRHGSPESQRIVIPGYADLRAFSRDQEDVLKAECGGSWQSYFQRGHWRMIFPFSRRQQERQAQQLLRQLKTDQPLVAHLVRFPQLSINHALVIFEATPGDKQIEFTAYDPNKPQAPAILTYDRATRTFRLPRNDYFPGGRVDVYEAYHQWNY